MNINRHSYELKTTQSADPLLWKYRADIGPDGLLVPDDQRLIARLGPGRGMRLTTWGRNESNRHGPHWIGVRRGTPLHVDLGYPRYTVQLVVRNDGLFLSGWGEVQHWLPPLTLFCLDTHSPHQLAGPSTPLRWYVAVSMDDHEPVPPEAAMRQLIEYAEQHPC